MNATCKEEIILHKAAALITGLFTTSCSFSIESAMCGKTFCDYMPFRVERNAEVNIGGMLNNYYQRDDRQDDRRPGRGKRPRSQSRVCPAVRASKSIEGAVAFREQAGTGCVVGGL